MNFANRAEAAHVWLAGRPLDDHADLFRQARFSVSRGELRALGVGEPSAGKTTVPVGFVDTLLAARDVASPVRRVATVIETDDGHPLRLPIANDTANAGVLLPENTEDTSAADFLVDSIEFGAYKFAARCVMSLEFLQDAGPGVQSQLGRLLGMRIGRIINDKLTNGSGSGEPTGIVTAATTATTAAASEAVTYSELRDLQHSVDAAYQAESCWMMHFDTLGAIRQLVDGAGQPLFMPAADFAVGNFAGSIMGAPVMVNWAMPGLEAGAKAILYGNFGSFLVREVNETVVRCMRELRAEHHQAVLIALSRVDGRLTDSNAVKALDMAE
jgi:HK97 family phage major capsid protein